MNKVKLQLQRQLLVLLVSIVLIPVLLINYYLLSSLNSLGELPARLFIGALVVIGLVCIYVIVAYRLYQQRIALPLKHFLATLEDISEGFIVDNVPQPIFLKAESSISAAFGKVLQINHQMLKNVDHLEKGFEEERLAKLQQIKLTQAYERFVPHDFIRFLQKQSIIQVQHGDHVKTEMSVMFADIRSFTTLSESISPEENFQLLNSYFMRMEPIIQRNYGFIDKFIGDGIMALFHQDPDASIKAAVEMFAELKLYNAIRELAGYDAIRIGIGINTGSLMLGIVGGVNRMEGTVISDAVNVASRIEDLNKAYNTSILISESTYNELRESNRETVRWIDKVEVKGKAQALYVYEVFGADSSELRMNKQLHKNSFEQAVTYYHQVRITESLIIFYELKAICPEDKLVQLYIDRCQEAQRNLKAGEKDESESK
jgi:class 3 adenylate cyclase